MTNDNAVPLEDFIQALTSQLDRAQTTMALKAQAGMPLTFAVKDLKLDLRAHVQVVRNAVHIRPAGPGDTDASMLKLELTTITRPMIEENTIQAATAAADPSIEEFFKENLGQELTEEDQRKLEWGGIHTISQLRQLERTGATGALRRVAGTTPVDRLRQALMNADAPHVSDIRRAPPRVTAGNGGIGGSGGTAGRQRGLLRVRGRNLMQGAMPQVSIDGEPVRVLEARPDELLLERAGEAAVGAITVKTAPGLEMALSFDLPEEAEAAEGENG